ncbi:hypothetical protein ABES58_06290 [Paenibacillus lautus]|uniref:hypothetical protein n=1 Tax=Paenibacillus lautus TaxID=1401 RepID=UPI003D26CF36
MSKSLVNDLKYHLNYQNQNKLALNNVYRHDLNLVLCKDDGNFIPKSSLFNSFSRILKRSWAAATWEEMTKNGYFDGTMPGATITREQSAVSMNRLRKNFLKLLGGNTARIVELEKLLLAIEAEK